MVRHSDSDDDTTMVWMQIWKAQLFFDEGAVQVYYDGSPKSAWGCDCCSASEALMATIRYAGYGM